MLIYLTRFVETTGLTEGLEEPAEEDLRMALFLARNVKQVLGN